MAVDNWNTDEALNTTIEGEDASEGCLPGGLNNILRKMAAALRVWRNSSYCIDKNVTAQPSGGAAPTAPQVGHLWIEW